ncbi:MAG: nitrous oxide reductase accessory protein NosL [Nitrospirae bacterium]|nr:nitrous oxide reductase accessory protein NosL [Nitrospirota bacterium]
MRKKVLAVLFALILLTLSQKSYAEEKGPVAVKQTDKCPVCGMFVAKYPGWVAQVIFGDGTYAVFDGPKDMLKYYFNVQKYNPAKKQADISGIYVTEYYSAKPMEARQLLFISGSDVFGPMGAELIPVKSEETAKEFMKDHKGKRTLKFNEITAGDLQ